MTDGELSVHWFGSTAPTAPTLLLLHGLTDSGSCWSDAVARWSSDYRIAAPDALGHGESRRFTAEELDGGPVAAMCATTLRLLRAISNDGERAVIAVGHSMGGGIAAALAGEPGLLRGVVLEEPAWLDDDERDRQASAAEWIASVSAFRLDPAAALAAGRAENPRWPEAEFAPWAFAKRQTDGDFLSVGEAVLPEEWTAIASAVAIPALVVTGTRDVIMTTDKLARLESLGNPMIRSRVIPDAGHCVRRDETREFHAVVDPWLADRFAELGGPRRATP